MPEPSCTPAEHAFFTDFKVILKYMESLVLRAGVRWELIQT
jgi:hypothetical protein